MALPDKRFASQLEDITLKQIDQSVVNWFQKEFPIAIEGRTVPVIYATAERWARAQKEKGFRDESSVLILPLVSIRRTVPDVMIERYVPESDETNITLIRRVATSPISENDPQPAILNNKQPDSFYQTTKDNQVYETLQIPFPSFVNLDYDITVWTSFMTHQNLEQENIYRQWKGGKTWVKINNIYFFAQLKGSSDLSNLEDFSDKEKIIKYGFKLVVQAYLVDRTKMKAFRSSTNMRVNITETSIPAK